MWENGGKTSKSQVSPPPALAGGEAAESGSCQAQQEQPFSYVGFKIMDGIRAGEVKATTSSLLVAEDETLGCWSQVLKQLQKQTHPTASSPHIPAEMLPPGPATFHGETLLWSLSQ